MLVFRAREEMALLEFISRLMGDATRDRKVEIVEDYKKVRYPFLTPTEKGDEDMRKAIEKVFAGGVYEVDPGKIDKTLATKAKLRQRARQR